MYQQKDFNIHMYAHARFHCVINIKSSLMPTFTAYVYFVTIFNMSNKLMYRCISYTCPFLNHYIRASHVSVERTNSKFIDTCVCYFLSDALQEDETMSRLGLQPGLILPGATGLVIEETEKTGGIVENEETDSSVRETSTSLVSSENVECCLQECPSFLHDELMLLFSDVSLSVGELRILTLCERTHHDMSGWSHLIEEEREDLLGHVRKHSL